MKDNMTDELYNDLFGDEHTMILGRGGSGKTHLIKSFLDYFGDETIVTSPQGIAAINIGGMTTHSAFGLSFEVYDPNNCLINKEDVNRRSLLKSKKIKRVLVDEAGALRADKFLEIDKVLRLARNSNEPFGGLQVILVGDILQIPSVLTRDEKEEYMNIYDSRFVFCTELFNQMNFKVHDLQHVFRQKCPDTVKALSDIRVGKNLPQAIKFINDNTVPISKLKNPIYLCGLRKQVNEINAKKYNAINAKEYIFTGSQVGNFKERPVAEFIKLKQGARVIICKNKYKLREEQSDPDIPELLYSNGDSGTIISINSKAATVKIDRTGEVVDIFPAEWTKYKTRVNRYTKEVYKEKIGSYTQIPLKLGYALTVHNSQGLTLDEVVVDVGYTFDTGLAYVMLSRIRDIKKMALKRKLRVSDIKVDEQAVKIVESACS